MHLRETTIENDDQVVDQVLREIEAYQQEGADSSWREAYQAAAQYIDGLYEEFTPHITPATRAAFARLGSIGLAYLEVTYGKDETQHAVLK
jgi:hypothetical protein